ACQLLDKPFLTSSRGRHPADVLTVRSCSQTPSNLNCQSSASFPGGIEDVRLAVSGQRLFDGFDEEGGLWSLAIPLRFQDN
ncbi:hypothetical protein, partial [Mesorhizobium shangrilense]